jgi:hypothetical protein
MNILRLFTRQVRTSPPEPPPDSTQIARDALPPIIREHRSQDGRLVILISLDDKNIYRGHRFAWSTHFDDNI